MNLYTIEVNKDARKNRRAPVTQAVGNIAVNLTHKKASFVTTKHYTQTILM